MSAQNPREDWSEVDYMAHGEESPDVWTPDIDPASVPKMPGAQEVAPGVFMVPTPAPVPLLSWPELHELAEEVTSIIEEDWPAMRGETPPEPSDPALSDWLRRCAAVLMQDWQKSRADRLERCAWLLDERRAFVERMRRAQS